MKFLSDILAKAGLTVDGVVTLNNTATGQTPAANDNSTKLATTAWVRTFVQPYSLPIASAIILGGIKVGSGLSIDSGTGVLSVTGGGAASIKSTQTFIATGGQTVFTVTGGYTAGLIDVFLNGVYLSPNQTTATNGTTVVLDEAAAAGDIIDVIVASPVYEGATTTTDQLPEGVVNLYYTNARARAAVSLTTTGVSGAATYNSSTGVFNIPNYQGLVPSGGIAGDILAKVDGTDYNTTWIPNYTSQVQHIVKAAVALTKGQAVYVSSADGTNMIVSKASNASEQTSSKTIGLVAQNLAINGQGFVVTEGLLAGLNTVGANAGDPVWLGTDGNLIYGLLNKPYAPAHLVFIGVVTRVNANNGEIFVKVQNGFELDELHDLSVKNASDGDMIKYVASTGLWTKIAATTTNITEGTNLYYTDARARAAITLTTTGTSGAATYSGGTLNIPQYQAVLTNPVTGTGTSGQVAFWNGTNTQTGDSGLTWNNTSKILQVVGQSALSGNVRIGNNALNTTIFFNRTDGLDLLFARIISNGQIQIGGSNVGIISFNQSTGEMMRMNGGNLLIGTTTNAGFRLDVNGTARVQGALTGNTSTFTNNVSADLSIPLTLRNQGGGANESVGIVFSAQNQQLNSIISSLREGSTLGETLRFHTGINNVSTVKWSILSTGQLQSNGAQTIQTSTGALTLQPSNNVLVGTTTDVASSKLTIQSTTQGFLPPRMTAAQRAAIASPATGLIVYQTDGVEGLWLNTSTGWKTLTVV
jgi:hypothetical protein